MDRWLRWGLVGSICTIKLEHEMQLLEGSITAFPFGCIPQQSILRLRTDTGTASGALLPFRT